jgi:hypothetical protein
MMRSDNCVGIKVFNFAIAPFDEGADALIITGNQIVHHREFNFFFKKSQSFFKNHVSPT